MGLTAVILFGLSACNGAPTRPTAPEGQIAASVEGPGTISAAVVEVTGASALEVPGGTALTTPVAGGVRAVLLLDEPGRLDFFVTPTAQDVSPSAVLVEVADGSRNVPASLEAYRVVFW